MAAVICFEWIFDIENLATDLHMADVLQSARIESNPIEMVHSIRNTLRKSILIPFLASFRNVVIQLVDNPRWLKFTTKYDVTVQSWLS